MITGSRSRIASTPHRPKRFASVLAILLGGVLAPILAQQIPALIVLPPNVAASNPDLAARRAELVQQRAALHGQVNALNARCASIVAGSAADASCQQEQAQLASALNAHIQKSNEFNAAAQGAIASLAVPNLANDPNAARLSAAQLRLVDGRITILKKSIALLNDSNPEWVREPNRVLDDMHEDRVGEFAFRGGAA